MENLTPQEIEELTRQLKEKTEEVKQIYDKLVEAGAVPIPEDFLDDIAGGDLNSAMPLPSIPGVGSIR